MLFMGTLYHIEISSQNPRKTLNLTAKLIQLIPQNLSLNALISPINKGRVAVLSLKKYFATNSLRNYLTNLNRKNVLYLDST